MVTKATADKYHLTSIADLTPVAGKLTYGGPPGAQDPADRPARAEGEVRRGVQKFQALDAGGPLTIQALKSGRIQAGDVFTTDPNIAANGWVILQDPKNLFAAQNVLPLINKAKATPTVTAALNAVSAKLDTATLGGAGHEGRAGQAGPGHRGQGLAGQRRV